MLMILTHLVLHISKLGKQYLRRRFFLKIGIWIEMVTCTSPSVTNPLEQVTADENSCVFKNLLVSVKTDSDKNHSPFREFFGA